MNFKDIHIGALINQAVTESGMEIFRICNFMKCTQQDISKIYQSKSLDTEMLLKWSKLLEYDFFRVYTQHLILYAPPAKENRLSDDNNSNLPYFRKNVYTQEIIDFIIGEIAKGSMTKKEAMEKYKIPKTTLYKWFHKYLPT